jgi:amino acid transporter
MRVQTLRKLIFGKPLPTEQALHQRLPKFLALPVFASDAISSSAYATEEIMLALLVAGAGALHYSVPVAGAIALLFIMVVISYRQTIIAYPSGGGAYIVARDNLGLHSGLVAAASLLTDYVLTVAVSIAAGVAAVISAWPALAEHRVALSLLFIWLITLANMRGAKESGKLFAAPTYLFILSILLLVGLGGLHRHLPLPPAPASSAELEILQPIGIFLLLRAFASGCAALTGIEAISNGVQAFRPPEAKNAATTLIWMAVACIALFFGITMLAQAYHLLPDRSGQQTVLSQLGRLVFGVGPLYYILQAATALILLLAANTSFADFPRLSAILAKDRLAPGQLANLGDRLVYANGIFLLGLFASLLVVAFRGETHALIPLYAVGVFISFTLSQTGMVVHWRKLRTPGWRWKAAVNALGALATGIVLVVVASMKFLHGAYIVLIIIPVLIFIFAKIARHYEILGQALAIGDYAPPRALRHVAIVLVPGLHRGVLDALAYVKGLPCQREAIYVEIDPTQTARLKEKWQAAGIDIPLTVLQSPWRSLSEPILQYIRMVRVEQHADVVTVVLPEFVTTSWWHRILHNQTGLMLKWAMMFEPNVVVTNVRYHGPD